jgi:hypothetical protein
LINELQEILPRIKLPANVNCIVLGKMGENDGWNAICNVVDVLNYNGVNV